MTTPISETVRIARAIYGVSADHAYDGERPQPSFDALEVATQAIYLDMADAAIAAHSDTIEQLREALAFYADRGKYAHTGVSKYYPLSKDEGAVARAALSRTKDKPNE